LVQIVHDWLSIILSSSCKDINVENFAHGLQKFQTIRSDIELELITFISELDIGLFISKDGMNKSLIKVKNKEFLFWIFWFWKFDFLLFQVLFRRTFQVVDWIIQSTIKKCCEFSKFICIGLRSSQQLSSWVFAEDEFLNLWWGIHLVQVSSLE